jgi:radical SAM superfamily enzyme YgiQ (UPF0313 family)
VTRGRRRFQKGAAPVRPDETWLISPPGGPPSAPSSLRVVLAYPATYEVAMSSLGFHAALRAFSEEPGVCCERAFLDPALSTVGAAYDGAAPLSAFDLVAFSVSFEADYLGLARLLAASGVPLRASDRTDDDPLVVMGGICASLNAEPVAPLLDAVLVGDADAIVPSLVASVASSRGEERRRRLLRLAGVRGAYVPELYEVRRGDDGALAGFSVAAGAPLPVLPALDPPGGRPAASVVLSEGAHFGGTFLVELSRGCVWDCRFCAAGHVCRPGRFRPAAEVLAAVEGALPYTRRVGLVSAALVDHPGAKEILAGLIDVGAEVTVSSLRADHIDGELAELLARAGVRTVTVAPEAGRDDLRAVLGKDVSNEEIVEAARTLAHAGIETLKLYFMVGLPGEEDDDIDAIVALAGRMRDAFVSGRKGARVAVSTSAFVPKPRTPFQWLPMVDERAVRRRIASLRRRLAGERIFRFSSAGPREALREGVLARGGRELAPAVELSGAGGVPWKAALGRSGIDAAAIALRERGEAEVFPWELIEAGVPREKLLASFRSARRLVGDRRKGPATPPPRGSP